MILEDDLLFQIKYFRHWQGEGVIADVDHPEILMLAQNCKIPVVGIGGSYQQESDYPLTPYVATDNFQIGKIAAEHLMEAGLDHFAFYGLPSMPGYYWAKERENAFVKSLENAGFKCDVLTRLSPHQDRWPEDRARLHHWLRQLPKPVGIMAPMDSRALEVMDACHALGFHVPDEVSLIGVDDDTLACNLCQPGLTSVRQNTRELGRKAADALNALMRGEAVEPVQLVAPSGVVARQSTQIMSNEDALVRPALLFIREKYKDRIKVEHVARHLNISRSYLEKRFRDETGKTVHQHIHEVRMKAAFRMLMESHLTIREIAMKSGFSTPQYFNHVFRQEFGQAPADFRNQNNVNWEKKQNNYLVEH